MKLTNENIIDVINKSISNAQSLYSDGDCLKQNGRLARAFTLFQLANEEVGKATAALIIYFYKAFDDKKKVDEFRKLFYKHQQKATRAIGIDNIISIIMLESSPELGKLYFNQFRDEANSVKKFDDYKNYSLYTSYKDGVFINPEEVITIGLVDYVEFRAKMRIEGIKPLAEVAIQNEITLAKYLDEKYFSKDDFDDLHGEFKTKFETFIS